MADDLARRLAVEQRKRLVASVMEYLEHNVYAGLSKEQQVELRSKILDSVGVYHDFVLDLLKVNRDEAIQNEETLRLLNAIHNDTRRLARSG